MIGGWILLGPTLSFELNWSRCWFLRKSDRWLSQMPSYFSLFVLTTVWCFTSWGLTPCRTVSTIGSSAFEQCLQLTSVTISTWVANQIFMIRLLLPCDYSQGGEIYWELCFLQYYTDLGDHPLVSYHYISSFKIFGLRFLLSIHFIWFQNGDLPRCKFIQNW